MFYDELSGAIDALGHANFFEKLHSLFSTVLEFDNFLIIEYAGEGRPSIIYRSSKTPSVHAELESKYVPSLYVLDPFFVAHLNRLPEGMYRLRDLAPDKFRSTSYFREYYRNTTLVDEIAYFFHASKNCTINVCVGRDEHSCQLFGKGTLRSAREIAPLVVALLRRHFSICGLSEHGEWPSLEEELIHRLQVELEIGITPRQAQVAILLLQGHSSKSIALELEVSWETVRVFRRQLYARCGITSQAQLFALVTPLIAKHQNPNR